MSSYTAVRSPSLCEQGKLSFSTFLTRNELPMSRKNVWNAICRSNLICLKNILFLTHHNVSYEWEIKDAAATRKSNKQ